RRAWSLGIPSQRLRGSRRLFSGQLFPRTRIEFGVVDGLDANNGGDAEDVVGVGAAREVGGGAVQAKQDVAVGVGVGEMTHHFAGDVAGVEVGEDEDVGVAAQLAVGQFAGGNLGDERGVGLEFAVEVRFELA